MNESASLWGYLGRSNIDRPYNNGQWSKSRFDQFIKSALRGASNRWGPKFLCIKNARTKRGHYTCQGYHRKAHEVTASVMIGRKRTKNIYADHIAPVVDPVIGFVDWNTYINRLFVELPSYQALCLNCHERKTADEKVIRKKNERAGTNSGATCQPNG